LKGEGKSCNDAPLEVNLSAQSFPIRGSHGVCKTLGLFGFIFQNRVFVIDIVAFDITDKPSKSFLGFVVSSFGAVPC